MKTGFILIAILSIFICASVIAQEVTAPAEVTTVTPEKPAKQRFDIGAGYWYTWSNLNMELLADDDWIASGLANKGDKVSELDNDIDAGLFIVNAEAWLFWRLYADAFVGWGDFDGEHKDSDWIPALSSAKWSLSKSDAKGDVRTWNINGYFRLIDEPEDDKGYLDFALGYFYYRDDIEHIKNTTLEIYNWQVVNLPISGHDSSDKYTFEGIRLGARGKLRMHERIALKLSGGITPWLDAKKKWHWNLAEHKGTGDADGTEYDINLGIELKITKYLFVEAGYKYIYLDTDNGDLKWNFYNQGIIEKDKDVWHVEAHRSGFYGMGRLKF